MKYLILFSFFLLIISCSSDDCSSAICKGDQRVSKCTNILPSNSSWDKDYPDGTLIQVYDGDDFAPATDSCKWSCDNGYQREGNSCIELSSNEDKDGDGVVDSKDNCPNIRNVDQENQDNDEFGDVCDPCPTDKNNSCNATDDKDNDGIKDSEDNCPDMSNRYQSDMDHDGIGDVCDDDRDGDNIKNDIDECPNDPTNACVAPDADGTYEKPFIITPPNEYHDSRDTNDAISDRLDSYPPNTLDESGKEFFYKFTLTETTKVVASIDDPEPEGVDIDLHILKSVEPLVLLSRGHHEAGLTLSPGTYYLVMDTYEDNHGEYNLVVKFTPTQAGTTTEPIEINITQLPFTYLDQRDTTEAISDYFNSYPPNTLNMSGNEYIYHFRLEERTKVSASLNPTYETDDVDIDLQLIKTLNNSAPQLISRSDKSLYNILDPGDYYIVADTFFDGSTDKAGLYELTVNFFAPRVNNDDDFFNFYILEAVEYLNNNYRLLGYASANLTHDILYGTDGVNDATHYGMITRSGGARTMCVSASMEVILTAMRIYAEDTGDNTIYDFLPRTSWTTQNEANIKGHIWVDHNYSSGTADALHNFGMGDNYNFEELMPGSFINLNRSTGTGHAVTFLAFLDQQGNEYEEYPENTDIIGFKYFSSQGRYAVGAGGFDYRWAIFGDNTPAFCSTKRCDTKVIESTNQQYLNTGMMWNPSRWTHSKSVKKRRIRKVIPELEQYLSDPKEWNGLTSYDMR